MSLYFSHFLKYLLLDIDFLSHYQDRKNLPEGRGLNLSKMAKTILARTNMPKVIHGLNLVYTYNAHSP